MTSNQKHQPFWLPLVLLLVGGSLIPLPLSADRPALSTEFNSSSDCATRAQFQTELDKLLAHWEGTSTARFEISIMKGEYTEITLRVISDGQVFIRRVEVRDCTLASRMAALLIAITLDPATMVQITEPSVMAALSQSTSTTTDAPADDASPEDKGSPSTNDTAPRDSATDSPAQTEIAVTDVTPTEATEAPEESNPPADAPPKPPATDDEPDVPDSGTEHRTVRQGITVGVSTSHLALPRWSLGPLLTYTAQISRLFIFSSGQFNFSPETAIDNASDAALRLWLISFHGGAGTVFQWKRGFISPLAGLGVHFFWSKTRGLVDDTTHLQPVLAPFGGLFGGILLTRQSGVSFTFHINWLLANSRYNVGTMGTIHDTGHALLQWGIGFFHFF